MNNKTKFIYLILSIVWIIGGQVLAYYTRGIVYINHINFFFLSIIAIGIILREYLIINDTKQNG